MVKPMDFLNKINNSIVLRVSAKGEGLSVTIPKELCDTYQVLSGDYIRISFHEHFREKPEEF